MRWLIPFILMLSFLFAGVGMAAGVLTLEETSIKEFEPTDYRGGVSFHPGEICVSCHTRFSKDRSYAGQLPYNVSNNAVLHIFPCSKPACHNTPPTKFRPKGTARWTLHLKICENCHPKWNTSVETIHNTHLDFDYLLINRTGVHCDLCHAQPRGYNSSVVRVPPWPSNETEFTGTIMKPNWEGDCAFCHFTIRGAQRVHDIHEPVLLNACPVCHSQYILDSRRMFGLIDYPYPFKVEKPPTLEEKLKKTVPKNVSITRPEITPPPEGDKPIPVLSEFYLYFNGILESLLDIYNLVV